MSLKERTHYQGDTTILGLLAIVDFITIPVLIIIAVILAVLGILTLGSLVQVIFNGYIILYAFLFVLLMYILGRSMKKVISINTVFFGIIFGFIFWLYGIYSYITTHATINWLCSIPFVGSLVCGAGAIATIPTLLAYIITFILWILLVKFVFALISKAGG